MDIDKPNFERFLRIEWAHIYEDEENEYIVDFTDWLDDIYTDEWIQYADIYANNYLVKHNKDE